MVEPLFRFDGSADAGAVVTLDGAEGHHAAAVRRMRVGESVQLTNGSTMHWRGVVTQVAQKSLQVEIQQANKIDSTAMPFTLVQALAKGDRDEMAIQSATEIGVARVIPWQADRSVSKWDEVKAAKSQLRWQAICDEASKQALRPRFVDVLSVVSSKQLAAQISASEGLWLVLDATSSVSITSTDARQASEVFLVVGPEGGISDQELALFESSGAIRVHLGSGILRTSTAGVAALAYLSGATGVWE
jgi:16S rRNA (uracil1498-N3)-methyltransferase